MGTVLQFSIFLCTKLNSALTTVITGVVKNVMTSYVGMIFPSLGYVFTWNNFVGINISMIGGLLFSYVQFGERLQSGETKKLYKAEEKNENDEEMQPLTNNNNSVKY